MLCFATLLLPAYQPAHAAVFEAWVQRYNGPANYDAAEAVVIDASGNVLVTGRSYDYPSDNDYYTAKYSAANGKLLWQKRYNGPANGFDSPHGIAVDRNGNVVVTGDSGGIGYHDDFYTVKYAAADGALVWERRAIGGGNAVTVDRNGDAIVTGYSFAINGTNADFYTAKYSATNGMLLWEKSYNGPANRFDRASAVVVDGNGDVIVTGYSSAGTSNNDFYTAKYAAADGTLLWEKRYNGPLSLDDAAVAIAVDRNGNVVVTGSSSGRTLDYYTARYASVDGALLWERRQTNGVSKAVAVDDGGNVVVTGDSLTNGGYRNYYTVKYAASDGALLWEQTYNGPSNQQDEAKAVAIDDNGNVVVTGLSWSTNSSRSDYYTAKYSGTGGTLIWEKYYNGPLEQSEGMVGPQSLALGPNRMVAVTGSSVYGAGFTTVLYSETLPAISIEINAAGVRLQFIGTPEIVYRIERAPAVSGPWEVIANPVASATGFVEFIDTERPPETAFYRTRSP
jgi:outer membrane protein assembly factor BamB